MIKVSEKTELDSATLFASLNPELPCIWISCANRIQPETCCSKTKTTQLKPGTEAKDEESAL